MISVILFLSLLAFMFHAGYQWRKWEHLAFRSPLSTTEMRGDDSVRDSMLQKL